MKVKCIRLLDADGQKVDDSYWLTIGRIYHVMSIFIDQNGRHSYGIVSHHPKGEWPQLAEHQAECFEVVSEAVPSNWSKWEEGNFSGFCPAAWQTPEFYEEFYNHNPEVYPIYEAERDIILREDP